MVNDPLTSNNYPSYKGYPARNYLSDLKIKDYALSSIKQAIAVADMEAKLIYVNQALLTMWGYDNYTQGMLPTIVMGVVTPDLQVRAYVDEILVPKLPFPPHLTATMFIRGLNNRSIPLTYVSFQPYTIPNIELSDERNERVDVRVLPIIFTFKKPTDINIFPGQLVDIYIKTNT